MNNRLFFRLIVCCCVLFVGAFTVVWSDALHGIVFGDTDQPCPLLALSSPYPIGDSPCLKEAKMKACLFLQPQAKRNYGVALNCSRVHLFSSAVALFYSSILDHWRSRNGQHLSLVEKRTVSACSGILSSCASCLSQITSVVAVDLRMSEQQTFDILNVCKSESLSTLLQSFTSLAPSYFDYAHVKLADMSFDTKKGCWPERYCEPLNAGVIETERNLEKECQFSADGALQTPIMVYKGIPGGLGSELHEQGKAMLFAGLQKAAPFVSTPIHWWSNCSLATGDCVTLPFSPHCFKEIFARTKGSIQDEGRKFYDRLNVLRTVSCKLCGDLDAPTLDRLASASPSADKVRADFSNPALARQFSRALSTRLTMRHLRPEIKDFLRESVTSFNLPHPIVSIHVRHGDKMVEMTLLDLKHYIRKIVPIMIVFGVRNIFLSTEDPAVVKEAQSRFGSFRWFLTNEKRSNHGQVGLKRGNVTDVFHFSMKNLVLAASCDLFVGTRQSNWNRLIDEIQRSAGGGGTYYIDAHNYLERSAGYASQY